LPEICRCRTVAAIAAARRTTSPCLWPFNVTPYSLLTLMPFRRSCQQTRQRPADALTSAWPCRRRYPVNHIHCLLRLAGRLYGICRMIFRSPRTV
jgi:hypothetical protein